jgi:hypothetical protein
MPSIIMRPRLLPSLGGIATFALLTVGLTTPAVAADAPSSDGAALRSGPTNTTVLSEWDIYNDDWTYHPDDAGCTQTSGLTVAEATYDVNSGNSLGDAFDDALSLFVGQDRLVAGDTWDVNADGDGVSRALTATGMEAGGLVANVEHRTFASQHVLRSTVWLTNPGTETVMTPLWVVTNLGSDSSTVIAGTSSGDSSLTDADRWLVTTDDLVDAPSDPVITHVLSGPGNVDVAPPTGATLAETDCYYVDDLRYRYPVTVAPGATVGVLLFTELSRTNSDALTSAARFNSNPSSTDELMAGLSQAQREAIVNWNFTESAPPPPAPRDSTPPISQAGGITRTADDTVTVTYEASDVGFGLRTVDLFVKAPGEADFTKADTDTTFDGEFTYAAAADGSYEFYTVATDHGGNVEATPDTADVTTMVDRTAPTSSSSTAPLSNRTAIPVTYAANDAGSGVATVDLYVKAPGEATFTKTATDTTPDGAFTYTAAGEGRYAFYTVATDELGNTEAAPSTADTVNRVDTTGPVVTAKMGEAPLRFDISEDAPLMLRMRTSEPGSVMFLVRQHGAVIRQIGWAQAQRGLVEKKWFGRDSDGDKVANGRYRLVMKTKDKAGNVTVARMPMRVTR